MVELHNNTESPPEDRETRARRRRFVRPAVDIYSTEAEMIVLADLPGVRKADVDVTIDGDDLILEAPVTERKQAESTLPWGFHRRFKLRSDFDRKKINAHLEAGILRLTLPRAARGKPKKIKVD